jgi:hypothetical protein
VIITGSGFTGATGVAFGSAYGGTKLPAKFVVDSDTQITATTPDSTAIWSTGSDLTVVVTTPAGSSPDDKDALYVTFGDRPSSGTPMPPSPPGQKPSAATVGEIKELTELIQKVSDAAQRDPLVKKLREALVKIQPFMPDKDAKKLIDDAVKSLVEEGVKEGIMKILEAVAGKSATTMPDDRNQTGPDVPQKDLDEHILKTPKIPIDDAPKKPARHFFEFRNGPRKTYEAGATIKFTIVPPDDFNSMNGAKRVVIVAAADRDAVNPERLGRVDLESASPRAIEMPAPKKVGRYVIRVDIGLSFEDGNMQEFEVTPQTSNPKQGSSPAEPLPKISGDPHGNLPQSGPARGNPELLENFDRTKGPGKRPWDLDRLSREVAKRSDGTRGRLQVVAYIDAETREGEDEETRRERVGKNQDQAVENAAVTKQALEQWMSKFKGRIDTAVAFKGSGRTFGLSGADASALGTHEIAVIFVPD